MAHTQYLWIQDCSKHEDEEALWTREREADALQYNDGKSTKHGLGHITATLAVRKELYFAHPSSTHWFNRYCLKQQQIRSSTRSTGHCSGHCRHRIRPLLYAGILGTSSWVAWKFLSFNRSCSPQDTNTQERCREDTRQCGLAASEQQLIKHTCTAQRKAGTLAPHITHAEEDHVSKMKTILHSYNPSEVLSFCFHLSASHNPKPPWREEFQGTAPFFWWEKRSAETQLLKRCRQQHPFDPLIGCWVVWNPSPSTYCAISPTLTLLSLPLPLTLVWTCHGWHEPLVVKVLLLWIFLEQTHNSLCRY